MAYIQIVDFNIALCFVLSNRNQYAKVTDNEIMVTEVDMQK